MEKSRIYSAESHSFTDPQSGVRIVQVTDNPSLHHHPFYYIPAWDDRMNHLFFISHRTGRPEIYGLRQGSGEIVRLTDHEGLSEWSIHPSHDGRYVYFTAGG